MIILTLVNLVLPGDRSQLTEELYSRNGTLWTSYHPNRTWRITMAQNKVVATCRLPLQTMRKSDVQQHLTNLDTMSTLVSDTLVSRAEPHPPDGQTSH